MVWRVFIPWAAGDNIHRAKIVRQPTNALTAYTPIGVATEVVAGGATNLIG